MSYSRWSNSEWYTYWCMSNAHEIRDMDNELFEVCAVHTFTYRELKDDIENCLVTVKEKCPEGNLDELRGYMEEFVADVEEEYEVDKSK